MSRYGYSDIGYSDIGYAGIGYAGLYGQLNLKRAFYSLYTNLIGQWSDPNISDLIDDSQILGKKALSTQW